MSGPNARRLRFCGVMLLALAACGGDDSGLGPLDSPIAGTIGAGFGGETAGAAAGSGGAGAAGSVGAAGRAGMPAAGSGGRSGAGGSGGAGGVAGASGAGGMSGASGASGTGGSGTPSIRWVGRVDASDANAVKFAWQGAGFVATVQGAEIAVKLRTEGTDTVFFQPVIDGTTATRFEVRSGADRTVKLGTGLSSGDHRVELYRDTEGWYGVSTFLGFTSGTLKAPPPSSGRVIEVVGDSISGGYGNLGSEPHPNWTANPACGWTAANSSWFATYANVAGRALDAEVSTIAHSGWGMYRDADGDTKGVLSSLYDQRLGTSAQPAFDFEPKASAVVINLGTNDWSKGDPGKPYEDAYVAFVMRVRSKYPDAYLFLTIGSMLGQPQLGQVDARLQAVVAARAAAGDDRLVAFDLGTQPLGSNGETPTGCDWHPNTADHARMAAILKTQLKTKLGW